MSFGLYIKQNCRKLLYERIFFYYHFHHPMHTQALQWHQSVLVHDPAMQITNKHLMMDKEEMRDIFTGLGLLSAFS